MKLRQCSWFAYFLFLFSPDLTYPDRHITKINMIRKFPHPLCIGVPVNITPAIYLIDEFSQQNTKVIQKNKTDVQYGILVQIRMLLE
jgi:hypothetical protein